MARSYYSDSISNFRATNSDEIMGKLAMASDFADEVSQKDANVKSKTQKGEGMDHKSIIKNIFYQCK
jgi:hypothetical protein